MNTYSMNDIWQTIIPMIYWAIVAGSLTTYTRFLMKKTYDIPMKKLAKATNMVAKGDFSVYISPLHTSDKLDYLDVMIKDFNKMVEELGSIETLKTDFFSNVSHEIKTPIAVIQNNAELLKNSHITKNQQMTSIDIILTAAKRLSNLITNMLKLNKLEKQTIIPVPETYDLSEQLCQCALQFEDTWEKKNIEFDAELKDRLMIEADQGLMELVWTNLLSNAFKFTSEGGQVTLKEKIEEKNIVVTISDTGCGMDDKTIKHIFDKFYQGDTSHSTEGNGLGLALVKRILELSGGDISVESQKNMGTTFCVTLPIINQVNNDMSHEEELYNE
ncbi:HAMP domain-containing sensor histidine kinase [Thomasclavelia saccharogumia]|nr:HAMP domain-containing sensor histidine kinase [Thomasclavelia saccharogumia]